MTSPIIRELDDTDAVDVRALVGPEIERSRYPAAWRSALNAIIARTDPDSHALVAALDRTLIGAVIYGAIAGSEGAGRVQLVVTASGSRRKGVATTLVETSLDAMRRGGVRVAFVELPGDAELLSQASALLARCGFRLESRVADFFRDGIDLIILRRDLR